MLVLCEDLSAYDDSKLCLVNGFLRRDFVKLSDLPVWIVRNPNPWFDLSNAIENEIAFNESMNILFFLTQDSLTTRFGDFELDIFKRDLVGMKPDTPAFISFGLNG